MPATATDRLAGLTTSVAVKPPCVAVTGYNIPLAGLFTIGPVPIQENDRVLVWLQTDQTQNGIYNASSSGWTRALDFDGARDVRCGTLVVVRNSIAQGAIYEVTTPDEIIIGTSPITFALRDNPAITYAQSSAEIAAGVIPTIYGYSASPLDVRRFGAIGNDTTDCSTAFSKCISVAAALGAPVKIIFPEGTYKYSTAANWGIGNITLQAQGHVVLHFTGSGNAWIFDGGSGDSQNVYNCRMLGDFTISGNPSATNGLFIRGIHHSFFEGKVKNVSAAGVNINFCVCTSFKVKVTVDVGNFTTKPTNGYLIQGRSVAIGEYTAWCQFYDIVVDSCTAFGIDIQWATGCSFYGGFVEFCLAGVRIDSTHVNQFNTFYSFDCESNTAGTPGTGGPDFEIHSQHNRLMGCQLVSNGAADNLIIAADAVGTQIIGGYYKVCTIQSGSKRTLFLNASFANTGSTIHGAGEYKAINCYTVDGSTAFAANMQDVIGDSDVFSPTIIGTTTAGTQTYTTQYGRYRKIGDLVQVEMYMVISAKGGSIAGSVAISNLPFPFRNEASGFQSLSISDYSGITFTSGTQLLARGTPNSTVINLLSSGSGIASAPITVANLASAASIVLSGSYLTD